MPVLGPATRPQYLPIIADVRCRVLASLIPPPRLALSTWIEANVHLPERDGAPHKDNGHVAFTWTGNVTAGNIAPGFAAKWAKYENAWGLLER